MTQDRDNERLQEIIGSLAALDDLWQLYEAAATPPPAEGSTAAGDQGVELARFQAIHATQGLAAALDHLSAWRRLTLIGYVPIQAHLTLLRAAMEGAVRSRWLVDQDVEPATRVARGIGAKRHDYNERHKFEHLTDDGYAERQHASGGLTAAERITELDAAQERAGIEPARYERTTELMRRYDLEPWYRLTSGAAHGQEWTLVTTDHEGLQVGDEPGTTAGMVSADMDAALALTKITVQAVADAVADYERWVSP